MVAIRPNRVSEAEFLQLPETMDRIELVDGEVVVSPSPSAMHQELLGAVYAALRAWARSRDEPVTGGLAPLDVKFGSDRILQPDAFVILDRIPLDEPGPVQRVPDLCVEVLSTNRVYDRVTKRYLYAEAGVREYWLVEPTGAIERCHGDGLKLVETVTDDLATPLLPGFSLALAELAPSDG
ncbi:MAG: Uma2 family endonuclease [Myxococcota bacterium]